MMSTARRRWSRENEGEVDGFALSEDGPVLVHGYDPPAGGMWIDEVIPGKLAAIDRNSGELLWNSPCEVGYGRGFGAGFGEGGEVIVLGPSANGHRIVRMEAATGKLLGAETIEAFDEAHVWGDICVCVNAGQVFAVSTSTMKMAWSFRHEGQRFHQIGRSGDLILVVHSDKKTKQKGILGLDVITGEVTTTILPQTMGEIHGMVVDGENVALLTADVAGHLTPELASQFLMELEDDSGDMVVDSLTLLGLSIRGGRGRATWYEILSTGSDGEAMEVSIAADSGKLYVVSGALVGARDLLTGRLLGDWTIPGLDEQVGWKVSLGAGLLAEEHRVSVFELPA
ncbi:MAG: outer membrane protein assembly factor BamB [Planctomycetota bacterium]|jgi:outer membrane protein assembly factor BamB